jgi:hypothetical protein
VRIGAEMDYFPKGESDAMKMLLDGVIRALFGLIRKSG